MSEYIPQIELEKILLRFPEKHWNWTSRNLNLTMEMIEEHPDKPWNWISISRNPTK